jgi:hypothetical protein
MSDWRFRRVPVFPPLCVPRLCYCQLILSFLMRRLGYYHGTELAAVSTPSLRPNLLSVQQAPEMHEPVPVEEREGILPISLPETPSPKLKARPW